jgi:hypothetical protein
MTPTTYELTIRAVHDALAMAGPADAGGGFIRTSTPDAYMDKQRVRLAMAVLKSLPPGTTAATADDVALQMVPVVRALLSR